MNLAAHFGRWSASHRKAAILGWLGFVLAAFALGSAIGTNNSATDLGVGDSGKAQQIINDAGFKQATEKPNATASHT